MTKYRPDNPEPHEEIGQRFVVLRQLREEAWGNVWLAQDQLVGVDVALKLFPQTDPQWEAGLKILAQEAMLAPRLRQPQVLGTFFLGEAEDGLYLVEEPFAGETLMACFSRKQRFSLPQSLDLLEQVCQALAFAHQHGVVHQSLNPLQILIQEQEVRVANFASPPGQAEQALHLEHKAYDPPEVIHGDPVTEAGNVFSLGVLGFRLMAGSLPYALTFDEPFPYRLETPPLDLEEIPVPLQNFLLQCLAVDPEERFSDAGACLAQLQQVREMLRSGGRENKGEWGAKEPRLPVWKPQAAAQHMAQVRDTGRRWAALAWDRLQGLRSRVPQLSRRSWWALGLAGLALVLLVARIGTRSPSFPPPEVSAPSAALKTAAGGPPMMESTEPTALPEPAPAAKPAPGQPPALIPAPAPGPAITAPAAPPAAKPTPKDEKYLVLAGSYGQLEQARTLARRLQARKLTPRIAKTKTGTKTTYQVSIGPLPNKKQAEEVARTLKAKEHLNPRITRVKPPTGRTAPETPAAGRTVNNRRTTR